MGDGAGLPRYNEGPVYMYYNILASQTGKEQTQTASRGL